MSAKPKLDHLDDACEKLLKWVESKSPDWARRIFIMRNDRRMSARQTVGACVAYVMEHDLHNEIIAHPAFEPGAESVGTVENCRRCHDPFILKWPGQTRCGKASCGVDPIITDIAFATAPGE